MRNADFANVPIGTELIWYAVDDRGNHHELKARFVKRGAVRVRIKTRDHVETWVCPQNLNLAYNNKQ